MTRKFSKKLLMAGIVASSLAFTSQSAFAATIYEQPNNDSIYNPQWISQYGNNVIVGNLSTEEDRDWYSFTTSAADAGRTIYIVLSNPTGLHAGFVMHKNNGETFPKTWLEFGNDNRGISFVAEGNTRYNIVVGTEGEHDPSANYYLNVSIF